MNLQPLRHLAILAAAEASAIILKIYHHAFTVDMKQDGTPVTQADLQANAAIEEMLKPSGFPLLSEETTLQDFSLRRHWTTWWLVDPLDGTKEFVSRNGEFTVNIALIHGGIPVLGVVAAPAMAKLWSGNITDGLYEHDMTHDGKASQGRFVKPSGLNENNNHGPDSFSNINQEEAAISPLRIVISRSHADSMTLSAIETLQRYQGNVTTLSRGSSLKLVEIACQTADIYPRYAPTHEWDTAAGHALVLAAGGQVVNAENGQPLAYNKPLTLNPSFVAFRKGISKGILDKLLL